MGQVMSYGLTQKDVEEVCAYCGDVYSHYEIGGLYRRFRTLDRGRKGYVTADELMNIPELSINPLAQRMIRMFDGVNFMEFCRLLMPFSSNATHEIKVHAIFQVFDVDGDGMVSSDDLQIILRQLCGNQSLTDEEMNALVEKIFKTAGVADGLLLEHFMHVFEGGALNTTVDIPVYMASM